MVKAADKFWAGMLLGCIVGALLSGRAAHADGNNADRDTRALESMAASLKEMKRCR